MFRSNRLTKAGFVLGIMGVLAVVTSPLYTEWPLSGSSPETTGPKAVVLFDENGHVQEVSHIDLWWSGAQFCTNNCVTVPWQVALSAHVSPITENPKVRRLEYRIAVEIFDFQSFFDTIGEKDAWTTVQNGAIFVTHVQYWLYEFNNAKSRELAAFYNPLDLEQRRGLEKVLMDYLNQPDRLEKTGMRMTGLMSFAVDG